jgi:competence protein ComEA
MPRIPIAEHRPLAAILVALVLSAGLLAVWRWSASPEPAIAVDTLEPGEAVAGLAADPTPGPDPVTDRPDTITVHVVGPVRTPGVVVLPSGSRVVDAIAASGGLDGGQPADGVNLARVLADGELVDLREPAPGPEVTADGSSEPVALDLNTASQEELQDLPGVGPVLAERIVAHREGIGGFTAVEQLQEVPGIGPSKYRDLQDRVRVGGG